MTCLEIARIHHRAAVHAAIAERAFRERYRGVFYCAEAAHIYRRAKQRAVVKTLKALEMCSATPTMPGLRAHALLAVVTARGW
jgi:hypothetical protein